MSESKYNEAYIKGINKGKELAYLEMTMNCADELQFIPLSVLDKIRAEIEQEYNRLSATRADETLEFGECLGLKMSLKIIDKYTTESEG